MPSFTLTTADGRSVRIAELLHSARPLLVDRTGGSLVAAHARWSTRVDRVDRVAATASASGRPAPAPAVLVRPDGYAAWAGADPSALAAALARWFGAA